MKNWWVLIIILLILAGAGFGIWYWYKKKSSATSASGGGTSSGQPTSTNTTTTTTKPTTTTPAAQDTARGSITQVALPTKAAQGATIDINVFYSASLPNHSLWVTLVTVESDDGQYVLDQCKEVGEEDNHQMSFKLVMPAKDMTVKIKLYGNPSYWAASTDAGWQVIHEVSKTITLISGSGSVVTPTGVDVTQPIVPAKLTGAITNIIFQKNWLQRPTAYVYYTGMNPSGTYWGTMMECSGGGMYAKDNCHEVGAGANGHYEFSIGTVPKGTKFTFTLWGSFKAFFTEADLYKLAIKEAVFGG
jgi:hypothetical protein